jgi:phosphocarrier protein HPr
MVVSHGKGQLEPRRLEEEVEIEMPLGLHARPASSLVRHLQGTHSHVTFQCGEREANGRSIVEILMLAAKQGMRLKMTVEGEDAAEVMERLLVGFKRGWEIAL